MLLELAIIGQTSTFDIYSVIGSQLTVAASATVVTQFIKSRVKKIKENDFLIIGTNVVAVACIGYGAYLLGETWMIGETSQATARAILELLGTSLMSSGLWSIFSSHANRNKTPETSE